MSVTGESPAQENTNREIVTTRTFTVAREKLFNAFADPNLLAQWWGPSGFTNTFQEFNFQAGGTWKFTMHSPDGKEFPNTSEFVEIVPPEKIVFQHFLPVHRFFTTLIFEDKGNQSHLTWRMLFDSPSSMNEFRDYIIQANEQNLDRLESVLGIRSN